MSESARDYRKKHRKELGGSAVKSEGRTKMKKES